MKYGKKANRLKSIYRPPLSFSYERENNFTNLAANESAYGKYKSYPYIYPLYQTLSSYLKESINKILITRGAEDGIKLVFEAFVDEYSNVVRPEPTFGMVNVYEQIYGATPKIVNYNRERELDIKEIISKIDSSSFVYLACPDNPTGSILNEKELQLIINKASEKDIFVLLDETYKESSNTVLKNKSLNLIRVGSFSKSHGLAGLRLGYLLAEENIIDIINKLRPMDEVNSVAATEGRKIINSNINSKNSKHVLKWKRKFKEAFPASFKNTYTNFILLKTKLNEEIHKELHSHKIETRINFNNHPSMENMLRITVGCQRDMNKTLKIIKTFNLK